MLKIVADANVEGQVHDLVALLKRSKRRKTAESLDIVILTLEDLGLRRNAPDRAVWSAVQSHDAFLVTDNRNWDSADSLQATIVDSNTLDSLPVITFANVKKFKKDRDYALRAAETFIRYLSDLEDYRGAGRLYIP